MHEIVGVAAVDKDQTEVRRILELGSGNCQAGAMFRSVSVTLDWKSRFFQCGGRSTVTMAVSSGEFAAKFSVVFPP